MRVVITGASGFVGSALMRTADPKDEIIAVTRASHGDIRQVDPAVFDADLVVHCASAASDYANRYYTAEVVDVIVKGSDHVAKHTTGQLVHWSSGSVYEPTTAGCYTEASALRVSGDPIPMAKVHAEEAVIRHHRNATILRGFAMAGPGLPKQFALSGFVEAVKKGDRPFLQKPGTIRSYMDVEDAARWTWQLAKLGGVWNVGGPSQMTLPDVARIVMRAGGMDGEPTLALNLARDVFVGDVSKALRAGCMQTIALGSSVRRMLCIS